MAYLVLFRVVSSSKVSYSVRSEQEGLEHEATMKRRNVSNEAVSAYQAAIAAITSSITATRDKTVCLLPL